MQITLNQILDTVRASDKKFWNINSSVNCPAAITGQNLIHKSFLMFGFRFGGSYVDGNYESHDVDSRWTVWTRNYCFSDQNENEAAGHMDESKAVMVSKETILKQFNGVDE